MKLNQTRKELAAARILFFTAKAAFDAIEKTFTLESGKIEGPVSDSDEDVTAYYEQIGKLETELGRWQAFKTLKQAEDLMVDLVIEIVKADPISSTSQAELGKLGSDWKKYPHIRNGIVNACSRLKI